jgi:hypothetical protein
LALTIKTVDFIFGLVKKALNWEIFGVAIHLFYHRKVLKFRLAQDLVGFEIPYEMAVHLAICVKKIDENFLVVQKSANDKRVWKICDGDTPVVNPEAFVDFEVSCGLPHSESFDAVVAIVVVA